MGKMSKEKGKVGEREVAELLRQHGFEARRGQQFSGEEGRDVVHNIPGVHIEVKRTETLRLWDAMEQARLDRREDEMPVVFHRPSRRPWVVVMMAEDFLDVMSRGIKKGSQ
jgi:Holliday junction resolvase